MYFAFAFTGITIGIVASGMEWLQNFLSDYIIQITNEIIGGSN